MGACSCYPVTCKSCFLFTNFIPFGLRIHVQNSSILCLFCDCFIDLKKRCEGDFPGGPVVQPCHAVCRILISQPGTKPIPHTVEVQTPIRWTTRESLRQYICNLVFYAFRGWTASLGDFSCLSMTLVTVSDLTQPLAVLPFVVLHLSFLL